MSKEYATLTVIQDNAPVHVILISSPSIEDEDGYNTPNPKFTKEVEKQFFSLCSKYNKDFATLPEETKQSFIEDGYYETSSFLIAITEPDKVIDIT